MSFARGTMVRLETLGWGITTSDIDEDGCLSVHLDTRLNGKRIRCHVHRTKVRQSAFCPVGACVETRGLFGAGVLVRYRREDGVHEVQFPHLRTIGYFSHSALKRTVKICAGLSVKTSMGAGTVLRPGTCSNTWMVKLPYAVGCFHERSMQCDPRIVPLVFRAKTKWHIRRRKAFAMLAKLQHFAEEAGLVPKEISLNAITSIAEDKLKELNVAVPSSALEALDRPLEDSEIEVLLGGDFDDGFADCAETGDELDALLWEECVEKEMGEVLAEEAAKIADGANMLWGKLVDASKDDSDVKRVIAKVDKHTEKLQQFKEQAEEAWSSSAVGSTFTNGASRIQDKWNKLTFDQEGSDAIGVNDIQDRVQGRFVNFLSKVQGKEAMLKSKGSKLFGAVQRRLMDGNEGWFAKTKEKVVAYLDNDLMRAAGGTSSSAMSISATIASATEQWVTLTCAPEESAAEIMDRWQRREAGDILEGVDLLDVLRRAGVQIPEPLAKMLETYVKDAGSNLAKEGRASGAESALHKVLESDTVKDTTETAIQWSEDILDKVASFSQTSMAKKFLGKAMGDGTSKGDIVLNKLEALDIDDVLAQAEDAYKDLQDPESRAKLVDDLLDKALDAITNLLPNIQIDNIEGETTDLKYALQNIDLSGFGIDKNQVSLVLGDFTENTELVAFEARGMSCKFNGLSFQYGQKGFPYISGRGCAEADATEISLELGFRVEWVDDVPKLKLSRRRAHIGVLNLGFSGSRMSWLYNIVSSLFQTLIQTYVCDTIEGKLSSHAGELTSALDVVLANDMVKPLLAALKPACESQGSALIEEVEPDAVPTVVNLSPERQTAPLLSPRDRSPVAVADDASDVPTRRESQSTADSMAPAVVKIFGPLETDEHYVALGSPAHSSARNLSSHAPAQGSNAPASSSSALPWSSSAPLSGSNSPRYPEDAFADDGPPVRCTGAVTGPVKGWLQQRQERAMIRQLTRDVCLQAVDRAVEISSACPRSALDDLLEGKEVSAARLERCIDLCFELSPSPEVHTLLCEARQAVQEQIAADRCSPLNGAVVTQAATALHRALASAVDIPKLVHELRGNKTCGEKPLISRVEQAIDYLFTELNKRASVETQVLLEGLLRVKFQAQFAMSTGEPMEEKLRLALAQTLEDSHTWLNSSGSA